MRSLWILLVAFVSMLSVSCAKREAQHEFADAKDLRRCLRIDIYAPFDRSRLFEPGAAEETYGRPADVGEDDGLFWEEYRSAHGRVRVYQEIISSGPDQGVHVFLRVFPSSMYISDLIGDQLAQESEGKRRLYLTTRNRTSWMTLALDGKAIMEITEGRHPGEQFTTWDAGKASPPSAEPETRHP